MHTRYDQYSALRTAELIVGLRPLALNDALATPMYHAFARTPDVAGTRYTALQPKRRLNEVNGASAPDAVGRGARWRRLSASLARVLE